MPDEWKVHAPGYFMKATGKHSERTLADGYSVDVRRAGAVVEARVLSDEGAVAASGYAAETRDVFIYDRITTAAEHRRKGLGHVVMATLRSAKRHPAGPELLVATEDGKALYSTLGWQTISPYSTASIALL